MFQFVGEAGAGAGLQVRGPPDLLGRQGRRLDRRRRARDTPAPTVEARRLARRRRRQLDARDRRVRARGARRSSLAAVGAALAREAASWREPAPARRATLVVALAALAPPAAASAHAALVRTVPSASGIVNGAARQVALTYSEPVEPRFAIVSVTDAAGAAGHGRPAARSPATPTRSSSRCSTSRRAGTSSTGA